MERPTGLAEEQQRTLAQLKPVVASDDLYLAGGTAIAHHLRHRRSLDLDLFTARSGTSLEGVRSRLLETLRDVQVLGVSDVTLQVLIASTPVDIVHYPYPLLEPAIPGPAGFPTAGRLDLTAMKLAAIARRGIRRDFWDLYVLLQSGISMEQAANGYLRRYGVAESDLYHVLKSLTYFDDADNDAAPPIGLDEATWDQIKSYFRMQAPLLVLSGR